jgi:hypothetical protein
MEWVEVCQIAQISSGWAVVDNEQLGFLHPRRERCIASNNAWRLKRTGRSQPRSSLAHCTPLPCTVACS